MDESAAPTPWFLALALGAVCLLAGYRMVRFSSKLQSAMMAILLGLAFGQHLQSGWAVAAILVAAAIAGFLLGNAFYYVNIALVGAIMGVLFMFLGAAAIGGTIEWGSGIASAVLGMMLAVRFERPAVILGTSMAGASLLLDGGHSLGMAMPISVAAALFVVLSVLGCSVQARSKKRLPAKAPAPRDP
jgi:hypothetical protein